MLALAAALDSHGARHPERRIEFCTKSFSGHHPIAAKSLALVQGAIRMLIELVELA